MKPWGAWSKTPGRNTNMKPPLRESSQSTARTLDTAARNSRPSTRNCRTSPISRSSRSRMLSSTETSAGPDPRAGQNAPSTTLSLASRRSR